MHKIPVSIFIFKNWKAYFEQQYFQRGKKAFFFYINHCILSLTSFVSQNNRLINF